jgi:hypothetical protein
MTISMYDATILPVLVSLGALTVVIAAAIAHAISLRREPKRNSREQLK